MIRRILCSTAFLLLLASGLAKASDDAGLKSQLGNCALKADQSDRLECYDKISRSLAAAPAATATPAAASATPTTSATATATAAAASAAPASSVDNSAAVRAQPDADDAEQGIPVRSVSCQQGHNDEYIFTLDNGEVWKQVGTNRTRPSSCEFSARIEKDFFGYKMRVDGENLKFRIKRVR